MFAQDLYSYGCLSFCESCFTKPSHLWRFDLHLVKLIIRNRARMETELNWKNKHWINTVFPSKLQIVPEIQNCWGKRWVDMDLRFWALYSKHPDPNSTLSIMHFVHRKHVGKKNEAMCKFLLTCDGFQCSFLSAVGKQHILDIYTRQNIWSLQKVVEVVMKLSKHGCVGSMAASP